jgi:hypothetical protein
VEAIQRKPKAGTWLKRRPFPRLINDEFVLRCTYYQRGFYKFIRFDGDGEYVIFDARNYPRWMIFDMWLKGQIYCAPRLHDCFMSNAKAAQEIQRKHQQQVLKDQHKERVQGRLVLRGL